MSLNIGRQRRADCKHHAHVGTKQQPYAIIKHTAAVNNIKKGPIESLGFSKTFLRFYQVLSPQFYEHTYYSNVSIELSLQSCRSEPILFDILN